MRQSTAEIIREYGPFSGVDTVHGVTYDGQKTSGLRLETS
jgi:hypothetical protein